MESVMGGVSADDNDCVDIDDDELNFNSDDIFVSAIEQNQINSDVEYATLQIRTV